MTVFWMIVGVLALTAAGRHWLRRERYTGTGERLDDDAVRRIIEHGSLTTSGDDEPLDLEAVAEAEEEFWDDYWDDGNPI